MAKTWRVHWTVPFESQEGTQYQVNILEWLESGASLTPVTLTGAAQPFVTMESDNDDVFQAVRGQTGYLSVLATDGTLLESLMPKTNTEKLVQLWTGTYSGSSWSDSDCVWQGFLCAQVYTQPWEGSTHVLQFPVQSLLNALDSVTLDKSLLTSSTRLSLLVTGGFNELMKGAAPYYALSTYDDVYLDYSWLYTCIEWRVFFAAQDVANEGSVSVEHIGWSYLDALRAVFQLFGLVMRERGMTLYVCRYGNDNYDIHGAVYSWPNLQTIASGGSVSVLVKSKMSHLTLLNLAQWRGTDNSASYIPGANDARVVLNLTGDSNMLFTLQASPTDTTTPSEVTVSDGKVYVQPHDPGSSSAYHFRKYTLAHTYQQENPGYTVGVTYHPVSAYTPTYAECLASCVVGSPSFNPLDWNETTGEIVTGAFPVRWMHQETGEGKDLLKSGVLMNMQARDEHSGGIGITFKSVSSEIVIFTLTGFGTYRFTPGYLHLSIGIEVFARLWRGNVFDGWWPNPDFGSYPDDHVFKLTLMLRVGTQYWTGTAWSTTTTSFLAEVKGSVLVTNFTDDMPFTNQGGLYIPIEGGTLGDVELRFYDAVEYENYDDLHTYILTDCSLEFKPTYRMTVDDRNQNVYRKSVSNNGFKGDRSIELKVGTYNNNVPSAQFIIDSDGEYIEALPYYLPTGYNSMERPERHLVNRLSGYYQEVRRVFKGIVGSGLELCDKVYDYNGRVYMGVGSRRDWRDDVEEVTWIELENPDTMTGDVVDTIVASGAAPYTTDPASWDSSSGGISPAPTPGTDESRIYLGTCSTAAATSAKVVTVDTFPTEEVNGVTQPVVGTTIGVLFSATNTGSDPTLNVNTLGAASIYYNNAVYTTGGNRAGYKNRYTFFVWDGTYWVWLSQGTDDNTTYTNVGLGNGIAVQSNSAQSATVTATLSSYALSSNGRVSVAFKYDVPASATLNVNGKGAKAIYSYQSGTLAAIPAGVINANDVATFVYNGTYYVLVGKI